jgi:hypothetical protein
MKAIYQGVRYYDFVEMTGANHITLLDGPTVSYGAPELIVDPTDRQWEEAKEADDAPQQ